MDRIQWCRPAEEVVCPKRLFPLSQAVVSVEPGLLLSDLVQNLMARGYTLPSWPMLLDQTIGGAISTGSHGSSLHHGTIADNVCGLVVVTFAGECVQIRNEGPLLAALKTGLGRIGEDSRTNPQITIFCLSG